MKKSILSVDAMDITKIELSSILKDYDINIVGATNEIEALSVLHGGKVSINAVIWTVNFVDELDFSAIRAMKRRGKHKNIPVIVISRFTDKSHIIRAIEAGASEYIVKPYSDSVLLNKILKVIGLPYSNPESFTHDSIEISLFTLPELFNKEFKAASRGGYPLSLFLVSPVQTEGTEEECINEMESFADLVKKVISTRIRETDMVFKYGNNIIVLLPFTDKIGVDAFEDKIKRLFESHTAIKQRKKGYGFLTASVSFPEESKIKEKLLEKLELKVNNIMKQNNINNKIFLKNLAKY